MRENEILESLKTREELIGRTEVLDKVKELILLPNTEYATTQQVADYFEVGESAIKSLVFDNNEEVTSDGYKVLTKNELSSLKELCQIKSRARMLAIFPKRAILRVAMLLRDSEVAKEIRTRLLDIIQDVSEGKDNIIDNIVDEIDEEKILSERLTQAIMSGDLEEEGRIKTEIIGLRNKRIKKLQNEIETITTNALTIIESKKVINKLVRVIAVKRYQGNFAKTWNELYKSVNYKLSINIKARDKKKRETYIDTLSEEELFEVEKITRTWANRIGVDVEKEIKLAS
jgi:hypothetical protein|uniref:Uncharacterized protein n=1 Tax=Siphoviridae sp. cteLh2 TaxID=2825590 RepID=A0A8S5U5Z5_9CAUD|nr:hypothetical protein [uncultured Lachnoclostridium sp.]DAF89868.1 MAG TPA: hypothetical protein [Siphoviridae sp. cteLh2]